MFLPFGMFDVLILSARMSGPDRNVKATKSAYKFVACAVTQIFKREKI